MTIEKSFLYSIKDSAKITNIPERTLSRIALANNNRKIDGRYLFLGSQLEELIENSNYLLVPCDTGINSQITISQMKKPFEDLIDKEKIFYIINNYKDRKSLEQTKENLISLGINENNILGLKSSKIFENGYEKNKCLFEIANETGLTKSQYKTVIEDWEKIVKTIK